MRKLGSILKIRDITFPTKVHLVKAMIFPVVMNRCESWTKKAEHRRTGSFELWCWRRFLSIPWTARRSNQSILKEISPKYSLEELMLKLNLQYFGHLIWRTDSLKKALMLGKIEGRRWRGCAAVHGVAMSGTQLSNWTTTIHSEDNCSCFHENALGFHSINPCHSGRGAQIHLCTLKMLSDFSLKCNRIIYLKKEVKYLLYRNGRIATSFGK